MVQQAKGFVRENILPLIIIAMFSAFWVQYNEDQKETAQFRFAIEKELHWHDSKIQTISRVLRDNPNTSEYDRMLFLDFLKMETRGGGGGNSQK